MDLNIAQGLVGLVNNHQYMIGFNNYIDSRIEYYQKELETCSDIDGIKKCQGAIKELRHLKLLYDIVKSKIQERKVNG